MNRQKTFDGGRSVLVGDLGIGPLLIGPSSKSGSESLVSACDDKANDFEKRNPRRVTCIQYFFAAFQLSHERYIFSTFFTLKCNLRIWSSVGCKWWIIFLASISDSNADWLQARQYRPNNSLRQKFAVKLWKWRPISGKSNLDPATDNWGTGREQRWREGDLSLNGWLMAPAKPMTNQAACPRSMRRLFCHWQESHLLKVNGGTDTGLYRLVFDEFYTGCRQSEVTIGRLFCGGQVMATPCNGIMNSCEDSVQRYKNKNKYPSSKQSAGFMIMTSLIAERSTNRMRRCEVKPRHPRHEHARESAKCPQLILFK